MSKKRRVVVVTGASQGIGAGLVAGYREHGWQVVATSRSIAPAKHEDLLTIPADLRERGTAAKIVAAAKARFGHIDTLVNNAGVFISKPFTDYTPEDFEAVTGTNMTGLFFLTQAVLTELLAQKSGHIINISAALVDQPSASMPAGLTALTKGGLSALTRALALEVANKGVRVNAVAPGVVRTPMHSAEAYEAFARLHPLGRVAEVKDVVTAVLYLESAPYITGEILHVDGGYAAGRS